MTIAQPLSVGVTSECEYMKVGFEDGYKPREIVEILNKAFPRVLRHTAHISLQQRKLILQRSIKQDISLKQSMRAVLILTRLWKTRNLSL